MASFFSKVNVIEIISEHIKTFGYKSRLKVLIADCFLFLGIPIVFGLSYGVMQYYKIAKGVPASCWGTAVTITTIFTPLTLTLLTSLYSMKEKLAPNPKALLLLREIIYNICYAIVVSLLLLIITVVIQALGLESSIVGSAIFIVAFLHLMLTLLMIIKRFVALFLEAVEFD